MSFWWNHFTQRSKWTIERGRGHLVLGGESSVTLDGRKHLCVQVRYRERVLSVTASTHTNHGRLTDNHAQVRVDWSRR